jgi:hypothetical protein
LACPTIDRRELQTAFEHLKAKFLRIFLYRIGGQKFSFAGSLSFYLRSNVVVKSQKAFVT